MSKYFARRPHNYGGTELDRGQILEKLGEHRNDEKLTRLGYLAELPKDTHPIKCQECGAEFMDGLAKNSHYEKRHVDHDLTPGEVDEREEREEKKLEQIAPLYLDKTAASRGENTKTGRANR